MWYKFVSLQGMKWIVLASVLAAVSACTGNKKLDTSAIEKNDATIDNPIPSGPLGTPDFGADTLKDFGQIVDGEKVSHTFTLKNVGKGDLIIAHVQPGCGCTTPSWSTDPIKPGETGEIKAVFNSEGKGTEENAVVEKSINVSFSNSTVESKVLLFKSRIKLKK